MGRRESGDKRILLSWADSISAQNLCSTMIFTFLIVLFEYKKRKKRI
jgi:hypothetical protein